MNQKAQVSLEYILIALAIVVVLSLIIMQATILYSKNINIIDNRELKNTFEKIQANLDIIELLENYIEEINVYPEKTWYFEKINEKEIKIFNENKEYLINSNKPIILNFREIKKEEIIIIKKENNKIYIELK